MIGFFLAGAIGFVVGFIVKEELDKALKMPEDKDVKHFMCIQEHELN